MVVKLTLIILFFNRFSMDKFWHNFPEISKEFQIHCEQGDTPVLFKTIEGVNVTIKDETINPNGSFKDRGVSYQIARHVQDGRRRFVLSSSGNAAISAIHIAKLLSLELVVFVSNAIIQNKLDLIEEKLENNPKIKLIKSSRPRSDLIKFTRENLDFVNLRGSTDDYAPQGYETIAYELGTQTPDIDAIFIPTSSGTSALGIAHGFQKSGMKVPIHICQSEKVHAIAKHFDTDFKVTENSLADAITDRVAHRKRLVSETIQDSGGSGWVISDDKLERAKKALSISGVTGYSYNSIISFSGLQKALSSGYNFHNPVLLFSGL